MRHLTLCVGAAALVLIAASACAPEGTNTSQPAGSTGTTGTEGPAPTGVPLVEGLPAIEVLGPPETDAGQAPLFRWKPVEGAASYHLAVLGPDGPLWAWQGTETEVYLGALPFERPAGWAGPVIVTDTCWSVVAHDADGHVTAASPFLPVSPTDSPGKECVPGEGEEPTAP
jgi:hypothetical protein